LSKRVTNLHVRQRARKFIRDAHCRQYQIPSAPTKTNDGKTEANTEAQTGAQESCRAGEASEAIRSNYRN
jgi:hypothetical protein